MEHCRRCRQTTLAGRRVRSQTGRLPHSANRQRPPCVPRGAGLPAGRPDQPWPADGRPTQGEPRPMPAFIRNTSPRAAIGDAAAADRLLSAAASGAVLLLPLALLYARAIGDVVLT